jgi:hypothetical protein
MKTKHLNVGYSAEHDCYFDLETFEWLESNCGDKECEFCNKPETAKGLKFVVHKNVNIKGREE